MLRIFVMSVHSMCAKCVNPNQKENEEGKNWMKNTQADDVDDDDDDNDIHTLTKKKKHILTELYR